MSTPRSRLNAMMLALTLTACVLAFVTVGALAVLLIAWAL